MTVALGLLSLYVVALIAIPSDFGPRLLGFVWSPARLVLVALALFAIAARTVTLRQIWELPRSIAVAWIVFLFAAVATTALQPSSAGFSRLVSLTVEGFGLFLLASAAVRTDAAARAVIRAAIVATLFVAVTSFVLARFDLRYDSVLISMGGGEIGPNVSGDRFGIVRQQGSFPAALFFAAWLTACSVLTLPWTSSSRRLTRIVGWITWIAFGLAIILLTASRIATVGLFAASAAWWLSQGRRPHAFLATALALATALGLAAVSTGTPPVQAPTAAPSGVIVGSPSVPATAAPSGVFAGSPPTAIASAGTSEAYPSESDILAGSNELRMQALRATVEAVRQRPIFGWGLLEAKNVVTRIGGSPNYVDSSYLALVVDMGLLGLLAFLALLASVAWHGRRIHSSPAGMAIAIAATSIVVIGVVAAYVQVTQGYATLALLLALVTATSRVRTVPKDISSGPGSPGRPASSATGGA